MPQPKESKVQDRFFTENVFEGFNQGLHTEILSELSMGQMTSEKPSLAKRCALACFQAVGRVFHSKQSAYSPDLSGVPFREESSSTLGRHRGEAEADLLSGSRSPF